MIKNLLYFLNPEKKPVLAKGVDFNYINDYPQDLYIFNYHDTGLMNPVNYI